MPSTPVPISFPLKAFITVSRMKGKLAMGEEKKMKTVYFSVTSNKIPNLNEAARLFSKTVSSRTIFARPRTQLEDNPDFPATIDEISCANLKRPIEAYMGKAEKILIVADIESQREIASNMLEKLGYSPKKVLDLNDSVESMLKMLRRLIGEDVDLTWIPVANVWPVKIDPSHIDQILANLCVNARDAVADVGNVTIETENIILN